MTWHPAFPRYIFIWDLTNNKCPFFLPKRHKNMHQRILNWAYSRYGTFSTRLFKLQRDLNVHANRVPGLNLAVLELLIDCCAITWLCMTSASNNVYFSLFMVTGNLLRPVSIKFFSCFTSTNEKRQKDCGTTIPPSGTTRIWGRTTVSRKEKRLVRLWHYRIFRG